MAKRFYVSKTELFYGDDGLEAGVVARKYGTVIAQNIAINPDGTLASSWALCVVESQNHTAAGIDPDVIVLPQFALDAKVSAMHTATKTAMVNKMQQAFGIDTSFVGNADGFRDVIHTLGVLHNAAFDENVGSWQL